MKRLLKQALPYVYEAQIDRVIRVFCFAPSQTAQQNFEWFICVQLCAQLNSLRTGTPALSPPIASFEVFEKDFDFP